MRVLLTGRGSIAQRHARHLRELRPDAEPAVLSAGQPAGELVSCTWLRDWESALAWKPQAVIIASVSARHADELAICLRHGWPCLAEKPLAVEPAQLALLREALAQAGAPTAVVVGCNLRYLPSLQAVRALLQSGSLGRIVRAQLEVGQHLTQWRPARELAGTYSAQAQQGGGALFDLVHEVDMAHWLLGPLQVVAAQAGHLSDLPGDADDVHVALLRQPGGAPVTLSLDYVSRQLVRRYAFVCERGTLYWDMVARRAWIAGEGGERELAMPPADFDMAQTYPMQMQDWLQAIDNPAHRVRSPLDEALDSTALMLAMAEAAA